MQSVRQSHPREQSGSRDDKTRAEVGAGSQLGLDILEANKVVDQHSTMFTGWVDAAALAMASGGIKDLRVFAHPSKRAEVSPETFATLTFGEVPVVNGDSRRLVLKTLVEFLVVVWRLLMLRPGRCLLVLCLMPTTMVMLELVKRWLPSRRMAVCLHGELEGALDTSRQHPRSYGFYVLKWLALRRLDSTLDLVVLDHWVKAALLELSPGSISPARLHVVPHPILPWREQSSGRPASLDPPRDPARPTACFVGYLTPNKGHQHFLSLADQVPRLDFVTVGSGQRVDIRSGESQALSDQEAYLDAIGATDFSIFPYLSGYRLCASAAVLDGLSTGTHVVATRLPSFESLADQLGPSCLTLVDRVEDIPKLLNDDAWVSARLKERRERKSIIESSTFSLDSINESLQRLCAALRYEP